VLDNKVFEKDFCSVSTLSLSLHCTCPQTVDYVDYALCWCFYFV
jgi:hypothetical protein